MINSWIKIPSSGRTRPRRESRLVVVGSLGSRRVAIAHLNPPHQANVWSFATVLTIPNLERSPCLIFLVPVP
ncbi:hypothetical protein PMG71_16700 [Roseofilum sp. BLCC_M154]|uniref:Uncharacterized protein n=1 Tax=Roseofilum acuticapitatum BLCC-M154 TaxID=3022444 RepID=A0ABT7AW02_9CYAN|nr:hypothetical protein [Roseofilum acuticapitatum]MDJ1171071.1 hypothetical protein [Roseofilum acuticapitatum BLCC-M154]